MRKNDSSIEIGERIKIIRKKLRFQQKEMAAALQIAASYLCEIESGKGNPGPELFVRLTSEYNINLNYLFTGQGEMFTTGISKIQKQEFDLDEGIDTVEKFAWLLDNSIYFRSAIMTYSNKLLYTERDLIKHSLQKKQAKSTEK
ncbi:MAG: helix-turn-helix domain-containing protein [Acidobacteria bacterium]|jgi:transcriptional regulator with XRE-family HTH domain|nr:helix-turn-helix domain-containing protein [Acidobacteriota bacterium]